MLRIPKKIHYCWFGGKELPDEAKRCIASWRAFLPEYEIIEWNEQNFDVNMHPYTKSAYERGKFAFVTDYVRLYVIYHYGGIYMDTDVEVLRPLDRFLEHPAFSGFENNMSVPTGIMASEKGGSWVKHLLEDYDGRDFIPPGEPGAVTNVDLITEKMLKLGLQPNNTLQEVNGEVWFYPSDYFCPKSYKSGKIHLTENSYCIHHFSGSWKTPMAEFKLKIIRLMSMVLGEEMTERLTRKN